MRHYNLSIDIRQQKCVVIGGGEIGLRKARKLCESGAEVTVVALDFIDEFFRDVRLSKVKIIRQKYSKDLIEGALLVFAATSDFGVNQQICRDAGEEGIWVNSVNGQEYGTFIIPATFYDGILSVGITTGGKAPALSRALRQYFQEKLADIPVSLIEEIVRLREEKKKLQSEEEKGLVEEKIEKIIEEILEGISKN